MSRGRARWHVPAVVFGGLASVVFALVIGRELDPTLSELSAGTLGSLPFSVRISETLLMAACIAAAVGTAVFGLFLRKFRGRSVNIGIAALAVAAGLVYLYGQRGIARPHYPKAHDQFHYVVGAKYFSEVGYFDFYNCAVVADGGERIPSDGWMRDLRTYEFVSVGQVRGQAQRRCREAFSESRWEEFRADLAHIDRYKPIAKLVRDHGYNGTPTHTFFASALANSTRLTDTSMNAFALIDVAAVCVMMFAVVWAFGWRIGGLFAILFFVNFSDRYFFIGGSLMRYVWMASLGSGIAMLRRERFATAGALIAASAVLNVFPVLFAAGMAIKIAATLWRKHTLPTGYRRFVMGAVITAGCLGALGMVHGNGAANYAEFASFIPSHADKLTSSRTGLKYTFLYRGQITADDPYYDYQRKQAELSRARPAWFAIAGFLLILAFLIAPRVDDTAATLVVGLTAFFALFGTVEYYYACTALWVLAWHDRARMRVTALFLSGLFALMAMVLAQWQGSHFLKFCNNTLMSAGLLSLIAATLVYRGHVTGVWSDLARQLRVPTRHLGRGGSAKVVAFAVVLAAASGPVVVLTARAVLEHPRPERAPTIARAHGPSLAFGGDLQLGRRQNFFTAQRGADAVVNVPILKSANLTIANLETAITDAPGEDVDKGEAGPFFFRARPESTDVLWAAGIDVVALANNHASDYGAEALIASRDRLERLGFGAPGAGVDREAACAPSIHRAGKLAVAVFAVDSTFARANGTETRPGTCYISGSRADAVAFEMKPRIDAARSRAHIVVVAMHAGANYRAIPEATKVILARGLIDAGADAVLGSSAHKLQGVELYRGRPILYDAGNLLFDMGPKAEDDAVVFELMLSATGVTQVWAHPILSKFAHTIAAPPMDATRILNTLAKRSRALGTQVTIVGHRAVIVPKAPPPRATPTAPLPQRSSPARAAPIATAPPEHCTVSKVPPSARVPTLAFGPFKLLGLSIERDTFDRRALLTVESYWSIEMPVTTDHWLYMRAVPKKTRTRPHTWRGEHEPCDYAWPTSRWRPGVIYRDRHRIRPPKTLVAEPHEFTVGWRDGYPELGGAFVGEDRVLGTINVTATGR